MSVITDFWRFIKGKTLGGREYKISVQDVEAYMEKEGQNELAIYNFALHAGINIIANALSMCEVRTFRKWEETREDQYYRWNFEPNMNMNAVQFKQKLVWMLIYKNECLVVQGSGGEFLIADSYAHCQDALGQDTFENVTIGSDSENGTMNPYTFRKIFKMKDVLFYRLSNRNITALLEGLMQEYGRMLEAAVQKLYKAGGERGILSIDANAATGNYGVKEDGTPKTFNDVYTELINKQFKQYFKSPNAVLPLFRGFDYQTKGTEASKKSTSEVKDVTDLTSEIYSRVANAMQIPPALLKGDIADVSALTRNLLTFAVDPIASMIEAENNRKLYKREVLEGTYQMIDTSAIMHMSAAELAEASDKMISCGGWNIDEIRKKAGDAPLHTEWSKEHFLTKNYAGMAEAGKERKALQGSDGRKEGKKSEA